MKAIFEFKHQGAQVTKEIELDFTLPITESLEIQLEPNLTVNDIVLSKIDFSEFSPVFYYRCKELKANPFTGYTRFA